MICSKLLDQFPELVYSVSNKASGNMSFVWGDAVEVVSRRRAFLTKLGMGLEEAVALRLGMTDRIEVLTEDDRGRAMKEYSETEYADAAMTTGGVGLFLMTADCTPAIIYDPVKSAVAVVHMSWQCTDQELARKTVELMHQHYGSRPSDLVVFLGPGVKKESYVQKNPGQKQDRRWRPFLHQVADDEYQVDVVGFNRQQLEQVGVLPQNIEECPIDTAASGDYFSHQRTLKLGEPEGRFATVAMIRANQGQK